MYPHSWGLHHENYIRCMKIAPEATGCGVPGILTTSCLWSTANAWHSEGFPLVGIIFSLLHCIHQPTVSVYTYCLSNGVLHEHTHPPTHTHLGHHFSDLGSLPLAQCLQKWRWQITSDPRTPIANNWGHKQFTVSITWGDGLEVFAATVVHSGEELW